MQKKQKEILVTTHKISCDGGSESAHPKVWLEINPKTHKVVCPYCETVYSLDPGASGTH